MTFFFFFTTTVHIHTYTGCFVTLSYKVLNAFKWIKVRHSLSKSRSFFLRLASDDDHIESPCDHTFYVYFVADVRIIFGYDIYLYILYRCTVEMFACFGILPNFIGFMVKIDSIMRREHFIDTKAQRAKTILSIQPML